MYAIIWGKQFNILRAIEFTDKRFKKEDDHNRFLKKKGNYI